MEENSSFNISLPQFSSTSALYSSNYFSTSESPLKSDSEKKEGFDGFEELKKIVKKQQKITKEQAENIKKQNTEIAELKKIHEKEKAEIIAQNNELQKVFNEQLQTIDQLTFTIQKFETQFRQKHYQIVELSDKLEYLIKPNRICKFSDGFMDGKFDNKRLNGKVIVLNDLQYDGNKWLADDKKISFKDSNFQICIKNRISAIRINLSPIINRIFYCTIKELHLSETAITMYEFKKLAVKLKNIQLYFVTIKNKYGIEMKVFDILKEVFSTIEMFKYVFKPDELISGTAQKLSTFLQLPNLQKMTTRKDNFFSNNNQQQKSFAKDKPQTDNNNLILNQNQKCLDLIPVQSCSKLPKDKHFNHTLSANNHEENKKPKTWCKSSKISNFTIFHNKEDTFNYLKQDFFLKNTNNNSTLSLHISAHENSTENFGESLRKKKSKFKQNQKNAEIFFTTSTFFIQNSFEFPRQQNVEISEPEVSQFKASQQLINPNEALKNDQQDIEKQTTEQLKLQTDELQAILKQQEETLTKQHEIYNKVRTENQEEISRLKNDLNDEMKKSVTERAHLIQACGSLKSGINYFKKDLEDSKDSRAKEIGKLQAQLNEALQQKEEDDREKCNDEIIQSTNVISCISNNNEESDKEDDEEKSKLKAKIFELNSILIKLMNTKRVFKVKDVAVLGGPICYYLLDDAILIVDKLEYDTEKWLVDGHTIHFNYDSFKLFLTNEFNANEIDISPVLQNIFYSTIKNLCLQNATITYSEYMKLIGTRNIANFTFANVTVKDEDGNDMDAGDLIKELPNIETFQYAFKNDERTPSEKFAALPPFSKLCEFELHGIEEDFDFNVFHEFVKKNPTVKYYLSFFCSFEFIENIAKNFRPSAHVIINKQN
uniref:Uncharacterized protein n=1 Tax=Panagrolaimus sp. PS1159 TaxID=55785 RepID=A0AC35FJL6_9BILA